MSYGKGVSKFLKDGNGAKLTITDVNRENGLLSITMLPVDGGENIEYGLQTKEWFRENTVDSLEEASLSPFKCFIPKKIIRDFINFPQPSDGNCLFHSLAQAVNIKGQFNRIRQDICNYMHDNKSALLRLDLFKDLLRYQKISFDQYISKMRQNEVWGGIPEMYVFMLITKQPIYLYNNKGDLDQAFESLKEGLSLSSEEIILLFCSSKEGAQDGSHFELLIRRSRHDDGRRRDERHPGEIHPEERHTEERHPRDRHPEDRHPEDKLHRDRFSADLDKDKLGQSVEMNTLFTSIDSNIKFFNTLLRELSDLSELKSDAIKKKQEKLDRTFINILDLRSKINNLYEEYKQLFQISQESPKLIKLNREIEELLTKKDRIIQIHSDAVLAKKVQDGHFGGNPNYKNKYLIYKEKYLLLKEKMNK
jgi:hypothetical protein